MTLKIYGASDDLIEVEGDIYEEFTASTDGDYVALSDGTVFYIEFGREGWVIKPLRVGESTDLDLTFQGEENDPVYTVDSKIEWVVVGDRFESANK